MAAVEAYHVSYAYGRVGALRDLDLVVPDGALYALLGPNGSGKTTLLQVLMGLRRPRRGHVSLLGVESTALTVRDRAAIGYVAEGQSLPGWMRLEQLEAYLAPLYPTWDAALARNLRERFGLEPKKKIGTLSRGALMKAALLCALAPRPRLLLMDEPFTGMDALVKDDLVRGLLESAGSEGWTVLLSSHDIGELELLADWVGFLDAGEMRLSEPMDVLRQRFQRVEVAMSQPDATFEGLLPGEWLSVERSGARMSFVVSNADRVQVDREIVARLPNATRIDVRDATLREIFVALARRSTPGVRQEAAA